ncbi:hypothetical protein [Noviherbaspirillum sp.]
MTAELVKPTSTVTKPAAAVATEKSLLNDMGGRIDRVSGIVA